jgi:hypothetical protein
VNDHVSIVSGSGDGSSLLTCLDHGLGPQRSRLSRERLTVACQPGRLHDAVAASVLEISAVLCQYTICLTISADYHLP